MPKLLTVTQAAKLLGVNPDTLRNWDQSGKLKAQRSKGGQRRYHQQDLWRFSPRPFTISSPPLPTDYRLQDTNYQSPDWYPELPPLQTVQKQLLKYVLASLVTTAAVATAAAFNLPQLIADRLTGPKPGQNVAAIPAGQVLAAKASGNDFLFNVNVNARISENLVVEGDLTAPNIVYALKAGDNITLTGSAQNPTISATDTGASQKIFKTIKVGSTEFSAASNTDTLTFAGGTGISISSSTTDKKLTITASGSDLNVSGWTDDGTLVRLSTAGDIVSLGSATGSAKLAIEGGGYAGDILTASQSGNLLAKLTNTGQFQLPTQGSTAGLRLGVDVDLYRSASNELTIPDAASISGALTLYGTPTIGSTAFQTLTLGNSATGNIALAPGGTTALTASSGSTTINNNLTLGDATTDTITFTARLASGTSIIPIVDIGADLGTSALRFNNLYVANVNSNASLSTAGQATFTYSPTSTAYTESSIIINPTSPVANGFLLGVGIAGFQRAGLDAEGDLSLGYNGSISAPATANPLMIYNHGTTNVAYIDISGNAYLAGQVGIGTTSPLTKLHVEGQCVAAGTLIRRRRKKKGKRDADEWEDVPVEDIQTGDEVLTFDEKTGRFVWQKVEDTMDKGTQTVWELTTSAGKRILTTNQHPYFAIDKPQITPGTFEVDLSIHFGNLTRPTQVAISQEEFVLVGSISTETKKQIKKLAQKSRKIDLFQAQAYAQAMVAIFKAGGIYPANLLIDRDYTGFDKAIREVIVQNFAETNVYFGKVTDQSMAHTASWRANRRERKGDFAIKIGQGSHLASLRAVSPGVVTEIRRPHGQLLSGSYYKEKDLSRAKWVKVKNLEVGKYVAADSGWERITGIRNMGRKHTFDLQIANTHNFVANGIVAHNTTGKALAVFNETGDQNILVASASGTNRFVITNAGNVGIGTTAPSRKLDVRSSTAGTTVDARIYHTDNTNSGSDASLQVWTGGASGGDAFTYYSVTTTDWQVGIDNSDSDKFKIANGTLDLAAKLTIDTSGNVGIGDTGPDAFLDIAGTTEQLRLAYENTDTNYTSFTVGSGGDLTINATGDDWGLSTDRLTLGTTTAGVGQLNVSGAQIGKALAIFNETGDQNILVASASGTNRFVITNAGNVGIGTTSPSQALDLVGSLKLQDTTTSTTGVVYKGSSRFIHNYAGAGTDGLNTFVGIDSGNFTMGGGASNQGSYNTAVGYNTLKSITTGSFNFAFGGNALDANTTGNYNTGVGVNALTNNITGSENTAIGLGALPVSNSNYNTGIGTNVLYDNTTGSSNTAIGREAGYNAGVVLSTNSNSVFIGDSANTSVNGLTNVIAIGSTAQGTKSNLAVLGNSSITETWLRGNIGIGDTGPDAFLDIAGTTEQLRLAYENTDTNYTSFTVSSGGDLTINATGDDWGLSTDRLTLGTTTAGVGQLNVSGAQIGKALAIFNETGDQNILVASASGTTRYIFDRSGNISLTAGTDIRPLTDSTTALNIANAAGTDFVTFDTTNSRVGIGTTGPGGKLHVRNGVGGGSVPVSAYDVVTVENNDVSYVNIISPANKAGGIAFSDNNRAQSYLVYTHGDTSYGPADSFAFWNGGAAPRMVIDSSGNVGIGTTSPVGKLEVSGAVVGKALGIFNETGDQNILVASASGTNRFVITNAGNVGIGTTGPGAKLDVLDGTARLRFGAVTGLQAYTTGTAAYTNLGTPDSGNILNLYNSSNTLVSSFDGSGNLGVGIAVTPGAKITTNGILYLTSTGTNQIGLNSAGTNIGFILNNSADAWSLGWGPSLGTVGTSVLTWNSAGNVGIGTTSPVGKLEVSGAVVGKALGIFNETGDQNILVASASGTNRLVITNAGNVGIGTTSPVGKLEVSGAVVGKALGIFNETGDQNILVASASGTNRFVITNAGNVGIGTTGPTSKLHVSGTGAVLSRVETTTTGGAAYAIFAIDSPSGTDLSIASFESGVGTGLESAGHTIYGAGALRIGTYDATALSLWTSNAQRLTIDSTGNVGIGDTGPDAFLDIAGTTEQLRLAYENTDTNYTSFTVGSGGDLTINATGDDWGLSTDRLTLGTTTAGVGQLNVSGAQIGKALAIFNETGDQAILVASASGTNRFVITNAGNVGIGTTGPQSRLSIGVAQSGTELIKGQFAGVNTASDLGVVQFGGGEIGNFRAGMEARQKWDGTYTDTDLGFYTTNGGVSGAERMTILYNGNVGIGDTGPDAFLDIAGTTEQLRLAYENTDTNYTSFTVGSGGDLTINATGDDWGLSTDRLTLGTTTAGVGQLNVSGAQIGKALAVFNETGDQNILVASASGTNRFVITNAGNVGIGTTSPLATLHISDSQTATASALITNTNTAAGIVGLGIKLSSTTLDTTSRFINFLDKDGIIIGKINAASTTTVAYSANGTDFAEYFIKSDAYTPTPGEVVSTANDSLVLSATAYDPRMIGIVSTTPAFVGGQDDANKVLVAIAGQVPVKIAASSPAIAKGDFVTSSPVAGRATKAVQPGFVIGKALQDWSPATPTDTVLVYINNIWADPNGSFNLDEAGNLNINASPASNIQTPANSDFEFRISNLQLSLQSLDTSVASISAELAQIQPDLKRSILADLQGYSLTDSSWLYATESGKLVTAFPVQTPDLTVAGKLRVGLLTFDDLEASLSSLTGQITVKGDLAVTGSLKVLGDSTGSSTLPAGQTFIAIPSSAASESAKILLTPTTLTDRILAVTHKSRGTFSVEVASPPPVDITFDWLIIQTD